MPSWTDRHGKAHEVLITLAVAKRLARETSLDLLDARRTSDGAQGMLSQLADDELRLQCLAVIHEAEDMDVFWGLFDSDAMESAEVALLEAIVYFFPPGPRQILTRLMARTREQSEAIADEALQEALAAVGMLDIRSELKKLATFGNGSSASSASSAVTLI